MKTRVKTRYSVLVVDPPWKHGDGLGKRGATAKYKCMELEDIKRFQLPPRSRDCVLFLWRAAGLIEEAYQVARAWGFDPTKGEMVWRKLTPTGKEHFGMGYIVRGAHEACIIATQGNPDVVEFPTDYETCLIATQGRPFVLNRSTRSLFSAAVPRGKDGKIIHSAKPDEFFQIVKSLYAGPRASVFERKLRPGFDCFGDEIERGIETHENHSSVRTGAKARTVRVRGQQRSSVSPRGQRGTVHEHVAVGR